MKDEIDFDDRQLAVLLVAGVAFFFAVVIGTYSLASHFQVH